MTFKLAAGFDLPDSTTRTASVTSSETVNGCFENGKTSIKRFVPREDNRKQLAVYSELGSQKTCPVLNTETFEKVVTGSQDVATVWSVSREPTPPSGQSDIEDRSFILPYSIYGSTSVSSFSSPSSYHVPFAVLEWVAKSNFKTDAYLACLPTRAPQAPILHVQDFSVSHQPVKSTYPNGLFPEEPTNDKSLAIARPRLYSDSAISKPHTTPSNDSRISDRLHSRTGSEQRLVSRVRDHSTQHRNNTAVEVVQTNPVVRWSPNNAKHSKMDNKSDFWAFKTHEYIATLLNKEQLCPVAGCVRRFLASEELRRHLKGHTGDLTYMCRFCMRSFTKPTYLTHHMRNHDEASRVVSKYREQLGLSPYLALANVLEK